MFIRKKKFEQILQKERDKVEHDLWEIQRRERQDRYIDERFERLESRVHKIEDKVFEERNNKINLEL